jgi:hypothetical protein
MVAVRGAGVLRFRANDEYALERAAYAATDAV